MPAAENEAGGKRKARRLGVIPKLAYPISAFWATVPSKMLHLAAAEPGLPAAYECVV